MSRTLSIPDLLTIESLSFGKSFNVMTGTRYNFLHLIMLGLYKSFGCS